MASLVKFSRVGLLFRQAQCRCQSRNFLLKTVGRRHHSLQSNRRSNSRWMSRRLQQCELQNLTRLVSTQFQVSEKDVRPLPINEKIVLDPDLLVQLTFRRQISFVAAKINAVRPFSKMQFHLLMKLFDGEAQVDTADARILLESTGSVNVDIPELKRAEYTRYVWDRLQQIGDDGVKGDIHLYNIYMKILIENKDPLKPSKAFEEMAARQLTPNRITYLLLVSSACERGDMEEASKLLQEMKNLNMPVSIVLYNSLIRGYCKAGDINKAVEMFKAIGSVKLEANNETYSNLILCHAERGDIAKIKEVVKDAETAGITLDMQKFLETVPIFVNAGHTDIAEQILQMVDERRPALPVVRNMDTVHAIVALLRSGHGDLAFRVFQLVHRIPADFFYSRAIAANMPANELLGFVKKFKSLGYANSGLGQAIMAANHLCETDTVLELYKHMDEEHEIPVSPFLNPVIGIYRSRGDVDGLMKILPLMERMSHWEYTRCMEQLYGSLRGLGKSVEEAMKMLKKANKLDEAEFNTAMVRTLLLREPLKTVENEVEKMKMIECYNCSDGIHKILMRQFFQSPEDWQKIYEFVVKVRNKRKHAENCYALFNYTKDMFFRSSVSLEPVVDFMIQNSLKIQRQLKQQLQVPGISAEKLEQIAEPYPETQGKMSIDDLQKRCPDHIHVYRHHLIKAANKGDKREVETISQARKYPLDMLHNYASRLAMIEMHARIFSDADKALGELKQLLEIQPSFVVPQTITISVATALCKDKRFEEALDVLTKYTSEESTKEATKDRGFGRRRRINMLMSQVEGTGLEERFLETLKEKGYITADFKSKIDRPLEVVLGSVEEVKSLTMDSIQNIFQNLIKKEDKEDLQKASDVFSKHKPAHKVLHRLAAAFAVEGKNVQARKVLQTPGLTYDREEIEAVCTHLTKERVPISAFENYHSVLKNTLGKGTGQVIVLFFILKRLVNTDFNKAVEFLETGFEEHGVTPPRSAYLYVAKAFENAKMPVPFTIPPVDHYENTRIGQFGRTQRQKQAMGRAGGEATAGETKEKSTEKSARPKAGESKSKGKATSSKGKQSSELMEAPVSDIIEKDEEIKDVIEQSDPAQEIIEKTEPVQEIIEKSEPVKEVLEPKPTPSQVLDKKDV